MRREEVVVLAELLACVRQAASLLPPDSAAARYVNRFELTLDDLLDMSRRLRLIDDSSPPSPLSPIVRQIHRPIAMRGLESDLPETPLLQAGQTESHRDQ